MIGSYIPASFYENIISTKIWQLTFSKVFYMFQSYYVYCSIVGIAIDHTLYLDLQK